MNGQRGLIKDSRGTRTTGRIINEQPLSSRAMNEDYQTPTGNFNTSRQFRQGIFTNQLNKKAEQTKKRGTQLPLEIEEVPLADRNTSFKNRTSIKSYGYGRESRDEFNRQSNQIMMGDDMSQGLELKRMMQQMRNSIMEEVQNMMINQNSKMEVTLTNIVKQSNNLFKKKDDLINQIKVQALTLKDGFNKFNKTFLSFRQENQEKLDNLVRDMANFGGVKKSKINGQYGMDLKNSFQGMNSSMSINLGSQSQSSKLVNQVIFQLDSMKKQINENKIQIDDLSFKLSSKLIDTKSDISLKSQAKLPDFMIKEDTIVKIVKDTFQQEKKLWQIDQKLDFLQKKIVQIQKVAIGQQENIKQMNNQMSISINQQINPKIKKMQNGIVDLYSKIDPIEFERIIKLKIVQQMNEHLKNSKAIKIRNCNKDESDRLSIIKNNNQDKISFKNTYLLDEQNYLLDSEGVYLTEQEGGQKKRIKIEEQMLYLLRQNGIQISSCS